MLPAAAASDIAWVAEVSTGLTMIASTPGGDEVVDLVELLGDVVLGVLDLQVQAVERLA